MTSASTSQQGLLSRLEPFPPDAILGLMVQLRADPRPDKIDLGVGVYRDASGATPVLRAVKAAEAQLQKEQASKSYLGAEGNQGFTDLMANIAFGEALAANPRLTGVQTPGGTGALRLGAALLQSTGNAPTVWIGSPTWPNHAAICKDAGLQVRTHAYLDARNADIDFDAFIDGLSQAKRGDVVLLHGCCHNPSGANLDAGEWQALTEFVLARGLVPFIDLAYQGFGQGLEEDGASMRALLNAVPEALVAYSCNKNFGLYRERVGALWVLADNAVAAGHARSNLLGLARGLWSMPPDHGAAVVRTILEEPGLRADWLAELTEMRERINTLRMALGGAHPALAAVARQRGMFSILPLPRDAIIGLRASHGIYMADSGRINIAGLRLETINDLIEALTPHLPAQ